MDSIGKLNKIQKIRDAAYLSLYFLFFFDMLESCAGAEVWNF